MPESVHVVLQEVAARQTPAVVPAVTLVGRRARAGF